MAGALGGDAQAARGRVADDVDDVLLGLGQGDGGGALIDGEVPRHPCVVPMGIAGEHEDAADVFDVDGAAVADQHVGHLRELLQSGEARRYGRACPSVVGAGTIRRPPRG